MKKLFNLIPALVLVFAASCGNNTPKPAPMPDTPSDGTETPVEPEPEEEAPVLVPGKVFVTYVTSWSTVIPDPFSMTHINYAFGHVSDNFKGVRIDNESRLKKITALKEKNPDLKVLLSIGGWGSGRFSEMAASSSFRESFAKDCKRVVDEFNLDGIDIDWEFPTSSDAGISSSPDDTKNYTLLMRDIRKALGNGKHLTLASSAWAAYIDFKDILPYVNFINIMAYDMDAAPKHHSPLYRSEMSGYLTADESVTKHIEQGIPAEKLTLGMPFYGRTYTPFDDIQNPTDYKNINFKKYTEMWDDVAKVPYLVDSSGKMILSYDNPRSLAIKCEYILEKGLLGAMCWDYAGDTSAGDLRKAIYNSLLSE